MVRKYGFWLAVGALLGWVVMMGLASLRPYQLRGSVIDSSAPAPEIVLAATDGSTYSLHERQGRVALIFFGYTSCPDVCPATLSEMREVRKALGERAADVDMLFITVDPARDSLERMGMYVSLFDPAILGLTGSPEALEAVYRAYGVTVEFQTETTAAGYLVTHSSRVYVVDRAGKLRLTYPFGTAVDDIVEDVRYLLKEKSS
ncbi:SCO family protein [Levilinea saccharolytica]|uniref:Thioredoxin domain-containing protein n=1 Tax=Levilinea saccharolytica TaxID=229921 RepID=A0A0P6YAE1_9CHLR|nr:SCO family protein [Levilinea saccharolytica]KPL86985.1 hypothetical protein ADN01_05075 [Levilinea saccharolytica]GAP17511.1 uncharacterized protein SCO1/SenC/PrrC [Levilinea saccharolytica]